LDAILGIISIPGSNISSVGFRTRALFRSVSRATTAYFGLIIPKPGSTILRIRWRCAFLAEATWSSGLDIGRTSQTPAGLMSMVLTSFRPDIPALPVCSSIAHPPTELIQALFLEYQ